jgi:predicted metal-dependent hydrolase
MPTSTSPSTVATRSITTRRVTFDHDDLTDRHYLDGDLLESHVLAVLSALIPAGERFIADAVRRSRDGITDPALRSQANAFMGQELLHQREHVRFNEALARVGYPTAAIDRASAALFGALGRLPVRTQVAMTAAIEHWTAVIAEHALEDDSFMDGHIPAETRVFLGWHLVEELEHKAIAADVLGQDGISEPERIAAMGLAVAVLAGPVLAALALSLVRDPASRDPRKVVRSLVHLRTTFFARRSFGRDLVGYLRPGFHPDQRDTTALLERRRAELFGAEGALTSRLTNGARAS